MKVFSVEIPPGEPVDFSNIVRGECMERYRMNMFSVRDALMLARVQTDLHRMVSTQRAALFTVDDRGALVMVTPRAGDPEVPLRPPMVFLREAGEAHKALVVLEDENPYGAPQCNSWSQPL